MASNIKNIPDIRYWELPDLYALCIKKQLKIT